MLTKGTQEYKRAQEISNEIIRLANTTKINGMSFEIANEKLGRFLDKIIDLKVFASNIAETLNKQITGCGYKVANCSDKQAWIVACAAVENNIEFNN